MKNIFFLNGRMKSNLSTVMLNLFQHLKEIPKHPREGGDQDDSGVVAIRSFERGSILFFICLLIMGPSAIADPKTVIAGPDSTVYGVAYDNGIPTRALIRANNLRPPYALYNGQRLIIPSPGEHIAGQGETLQSIAEDHGVNVDVLAQENDLHVVKPGEQLMIPSRDTESMANAFQQPAHDIQTSSLAPLASVKNAPTTGNRPTPSPTEKNVPHELAEEIAREKGVKPYTSSVSLKDAESSQPMLMGNLTQRNAGAPTAATSTAPPPEEDGIPQPKKAAKKPEKKKEKTVEKKKKETSKDSFAEKKEEEEKEKEQLKEIQPQFIWPVEGDVVTKFKSGKNDGIKIKVSEGTPVKAAASGDVLYAGSELKGFGNLLLLKHEGGWVTAYAHNSTLLVKKGDKVKQGQVIAKSGQTGDVKTPQLHFEVRKGKQPVDPLAQLES